MGRASAGERRTPRVVSEREPPPDRLRFRRVSAERAVLAQVVALASPLLDQDLRLLEREEELSVQQLVVQLAVRLDPE